MACSPIYIFEIAGRGADIYNPCVDWDYHIGRIDKTVNASAGI